jgi:hypothetical protein
MRYTWNADRTSSFKSTHKTIIIIVDEIYDEKSKLHVGAQFSNANGTSTVCKCHPDRL